MYKISLQHKTPTLTDKRLYSKQSKRIVNFKIKHFLSVWQISSCVDRGRIVGEATGSNITTKIVLKSVGCMEMKET